MSFSAAELKKRREEYKDKFGGMFLQGGSEKGSFIQEMIDVQSERAFDVIGGHTWQEAVATYGPRLMYAEIASINTRLKRIFWDGPDMPSKVNLKRAEDLLIDLANYASFLHEWIQGTQESE